MKAIFEHSGTVIEIGNGIVLGERDTTGRFSGSTHPGAIGVAVYQRALDDQQKLEYRAGFHVSHSEARAIASMLLSAATAAK